MSTNFVQFNPAVSNQETDAQYIADSLRAGGIQLDNIIPSNLLNKAFYQWSTFVAAFASMLAAKGYSTSDTSFSNLASQLSVLITEADLTGGFQLLPYSPDPTFSAAATSSWKMLLTGNVNSSSISGVHAGQTLTFCWKQDATGNRAITYPSSFYGFAPIDPTPNSTSVQSGFVEDDLTIHAVTPVVSS